MKKKLVFALLRILISIGLLGYIISLINFNDIVDPETSQVEPGLFSLLEQVNLIWFIPAFVSLGLIVVLAALRWWLLLGGQGITIRYKDVFRLAYLGYFFNNFMLGSLGGDLAKAILVSHQTKRTTKPIFSIIFDRFIGFIVLATICTVGVMISYQRPEFRELKTIVIIGWAIFLTLYLIYRYLNLSQGRVRQRILSKLPFQRFFSEVKEALDNYRHKTGLILKTVGISVLIHICVIGVNIAYALALGIKGVPFYYYIILVAVIGFLTSLPISVGGWGVSETCYGYFFGFLGVQLTQAVMLSLLYRLSITLWSLPGGLFLLTKPKLEAPPR